MKRYELNTNYLKYLINEKFGSISNFANVTKVSQETLYYWLRTKKMPTNKFFHIIDLLEIEDVNKLRKDFKNE